MVERLIEKTGPAVQLDAPPQTKGEKTRERILDIAYESIVQKGFAATSIEELVEAAGITKSGFFYHFKDKNDLARQVFDRFLSEDERIVERLVERSRELSDDPLQSLLIFLNLYAQLMDDMESIHPGCMVASVTYQERLFDREVRDMNTAYLLRMRTRFEAWLREIADQTPPKLDTDLTALADQLTVIVEGAIILSKALAEPALLGRQARLYRQYIRLLFGG
jgi:TetR/AcrR family transcriptional regulator, transcriptional repressor for nem operon